MLLFLWIYLHKGKKYNVWPKVGRHLTITPTCAISVWAQGSVQFIQDVLHQSLKTTSIRTLFCARGTGMQKHAWARPNSSSESKCWKKQFIYKFTSALTRNSLLSNAELCVDTDLVWVVFEAPAFHYVTQASGEISWLHPQGLDRIGYNE